MEDLYTRFSAPDRSDDLCGLVSLVGESARYSLIQTPVNAVAQIYDNATGKNSLPSVQFLDAPAQESFSPTNTRWYAQQFGNALGMLAHFYVLDKVMPGKSIASRELAMSDGLSIVGRSAALGGGYNALFVPSEGKDLLSERAIGGVSGAMTFGTLAASSLGWRKLTSYTSSPTRLLFGNDMVAGAIAGVPAGLVSAETHSLLSGKGLASNEERAQSVLGFSVVGGGLGLAHGVEHLATRPKTPMMAERLSKVFVSEPTGRLGETIGKSATPLVERALSNAAPEPGGRVERALAEAGLELRNGSYVESIEALMTAKDWSETTSRPEEKVVHAFETLERHLGANHPDVQRTILQFEAKHRESLDYSQNVQPALEIKVRALEERYSPVDPDVAEAVVDLARYHEYHGNWDQAVGALKKAAEIHRGSYGTDTQIAEVLAMQGNILTNTKQYKDAVPVLKEALDLYQSFGRANRNANAIAIQANLAESLLYTGHREAAEELLMQAIDNAGIVPSASESLHKALQTTAAMYLRDGKVSDAAIMYRQSNRAARGSSGRTSWFTQTAELTGETTFCDELTPTGNPYLEAFKQVTAQVPESQLMNAREVLVQKYSWSVPTEEALAKIAALGPVVEVGAGTGYWAALLRQRGADVVAYDAHPVESGRSGFHKTADRSWTPISEGTETSVSQHADRTLFLSWPPKGEPMAANTLAAFGGNKLVYVGEGWGGVTGDYRFHNMLADGWTLAEQVAIPRWDGRSDSMYIYNRK